MVGIPELCGPLGGDGIEAIAFDKGGTVDLKGAKVSMVDPTHSSSTETDDGPRYKGHEAGCMIAGDGHMIHVSGDTDILADMEWMGDLHNQTWAFSAPVVTTRWTWRGPVLRQERHFDFATVIPCHAKTLPELAQDVQVLTYALPGVDVKTLEVMETASLWDPEFSSKIRRLRFFCEKSSAALCEEGLQQCL